MAAEVAEEIRTQLLSILEGGSRYRTEKVSVIVGYLVICTATLIWSFSGANQENDLGARFGLETIAPLDDKLLFLENTSGDDWTRVRIVLNRNYLYKADKVEDQQRLVLQSEDFNYFYYIPRPWGREEWELLAKGEKPDSKAAPKLAPTLVEVRAREGRLDIDASQLQ